VRAKHGNPVEVQSVFGRTGKPTARNAQSLGGNRMTKKPNAGGGNAAGNRESRTSPSSWSSWITGRIPGLVPGPKGR
jgi:hypothetical protein